jgi:hypothetical protein
MATSGFSKIEADVAFVGIGYGFPTIGCVF